MDPLHVIPEEEWPKLEEFLKRDWPRCFVLTSWMTIRKKWSISHPGRNPVYICCPYGVIEDGLVAFGKTGTKYYYLNMYTFHNDLTKLRQALLQTKRIKWDDFMDCGIPTEAGEWFGNVLNELGYDVAHSITTNCFLLPKETATTLTTKCPDHVYIDLLQVRDIPKINSLWDYGSEGSERFILDCIELNYGYGLYIKQTGELISWVIRGEHGDAAALKTVEEHRNKGYAKLLIEALCKRIADDGEDMLSYVVRGNEIPEYNQQKYKSILIAVYDWIQYKKKKVISSL